MVAAWSRSRWVGCATETYTRSCWAPWRVKDVDVRMETSEVSRALGASSWAA